MPPKNEHKQPPPISVPSSSIKSSKKESMKPSQSNNNNLIDLDDQNSVRVSILETFDPLLSISENESIRTCSPEYLGKNINLKINGLF